VLVLWKLDPLEAHRTCGRDVVATPGRTTHEALREKVAFATTMGPGILVDPARTRNLLETEEV